MLRSIVLVVIVAMKIVAVDAQGKLFHLFLFLVLLMRNLLQNLLYFIAERMFRVFCLTSYSVD